MIRHLLGTSLAVWLAAVMAAAAQGPTGRPPAPAKEQTPAERESARLLEISIWARDTKAPAAEVQRRVFAPIVAGNEADAERNRQAAVAMAKNAEEAHRSLQEQDVKRYRALAELFGECTKENRRFLAAYRAADMKTAGDALRKLRAYDDRIAEFAGRRMERSWYAHETMVATMGMTSEEIRQQFEQLKPGKAQPAPAAPTAPTPVPRQR